MADVKSVVLAKAYAIKPKVYCLRLKPLHGIRSLMTLIKGPLLG